MRPDICVAVSRVSQHLVNPTPEHAKHLYHLIRYLKASQDRPLFIDPSSKHDVEIYSDSNFADASDKRRRSTSGTVVTYHGRPVAWKSKLQTCTADSTHEAELYAMHQSMKLGLGIRRTLIDMNLLFQSSPTVLYVDNSATVCTANQIYQISNRNRHIDTRYFKIRDHVESNDIRVEWKSGKVNPADLFTKALDVSTVSLHADFLLSGIPYSPSAMGGCVDSTPPQAIPRVPIDHLGYALGFDP